MNNEPNDDPLQEYANEAVEGVYDIFDDLSLDTEERTRLARMIIDTLQSDIDSGEL